MICIRPLENAEHHIPDVSDGKVSRKRIKRCALALLRIFQILLAGFEVDLYTLYELSYKVYYANPALIRTIMAETL